MKTETQTNLASLLTDQSLLCSKAFIGGEWRDAPDKKTFPVYNPARGDILANLPDLSRKDAATAINAADSARHAWAARTGKDRAQILRKWFDLIIENQQDLAIILTAEMGKPIAEAFGEIAYAASFIEWFGEEAKRVYGETIPAHQPDKRITVLKQPIGVVCSITPWNFPSAMIARKVAPALATGCAFVGRPAAQTPLSALALAVLAERAGVPKGVFSVITSARAADIGKEFCENPKVRKLTFTGSTEVGRVLMAQAAPQIMKLSLELGGNAPFIVFDDADLDKAVEGAMICKFRNNGQTCVCANRIYVQAGVYDAFCERLTAAVQALKIGDGLTEGVTTGPLIDKNGLDKVRAHIDDALGKGARLVCGGEPMGGTFFQPTVLADVPASAIMSREETFGPLAPLIRFESESEVLAAANDTIFGLACYFYSNDLSRVVRMQERLEYGIVGVNTGIISTEVAPFGGIKQSGLGREGSHHGMDDYLELKYVCTAVNDEL